METITITATAITTLIFTKAIEQGGRRLGDVVYNKIDELVKLIHTKFKKEGVEGKITKAQKNPSEDNKNKFACELKEQMEDDKEFTQQLQEIIKQIKTEDKTLYQKVLSNITTTKSLKIKEIEQEARNSSKAEQTALENVQAESVDIGKISQKG